MKAHELLIDKTVWIQGWSARDKDGKNVPPNSAGAIRFCMLGAIEKCYNADALAMKAKLAEHILTNKLLGDNEQKCLTFLLQKRLSHLEGKVKNQVAISSLNDEKTTTFEAVQSLLKQLDI